MKNLIPHMTNEIQHQLWLIYCQLKDAEGDSDRRLFLLEKSRVELGQALRAIDTSVEASESFD